MWADGSIRLERQVRIFVSSTYLDLRDARGNLRDWLTGVFETELVVMETFGSAERVNDFETPGVMRLVSKRV
jgi:hypothetical protein